MISKALVKKISLLKSLKHRKEEGRFLVEGVKMVDELIESKRRILAVFALEDYIQDREKELKDIADEVYIVNSDELQKLSNLSTPNKVIALMENILTKPIENENRLVIALDGIKDPGNLGTIIRLADWFGIKDIICSEDSVELYNPKTVQSTMGSLFRVNVTCQNLEEYLKVLDKKYKVFGTVVQGGKNIYTQDLPNQGIIVIGSESHGISKEILPLITNPITIPCFSLDQKIESLNASIATSIICAEFARQNQVKR